MKTIAKKITELLSSNEVGSYSFTVNYNSSLTDDDTEYELVESLAFTFTEKNSANNISLKIEMPFSFHLLEKENSEIKTQSVAALLNLIKDNFDLSIPLLLNENYKELSELIH